MKKINEMCSVALYGTGKVAERFLKENADVHILAVFDGYNSAGVFKGIKIHPLTDAVELGVKNIIVASSLSVKEVIYNRIFPFCKMHNISLLDENGNDVAKYLNSKSWNIEVYDNLDIELLKSEIYCHDIISFDIFDTLVMRKILYPTDVFDIVESRASTLGNDVRKRFKRGRILAEHVVLAENNHTLDSIYEELQKYLSIDKKICDRLKGMELEVEKEVIIPRKIMVDVFRYAISLKKRVCLISDMYLPKDFLTSVLHNLGIKGYEEILISGYEGCSKSSGLFFLYQKSFVGDTYLHIGDNKAADGLAARIAGIDAFLIPSGLSVLKLHYDSFSLLPIDRFADRCVIGLYTAKRYNNPFDSIGVDKQMISSIRSFAYIFLGPLCTLFIVWLIKMLHSEEYDKVLFPSRDGYLLKILYDKMVAYFDMTLPESKYFYTSRKAASKIGIKTAKDKKEFDKWFIDYSEYSKNCGSGNEDGFAKYLNSEHIDLHKRYAFIEFISSGTTQYYLQKNALKNLDGYYLEWHRGAVKAALPICTFLELPEDAKIFNSLQETRIIENVLTSSEPSVIDYDDTGTPLFAEEMRMEKQLEWMNDAQIGIIDYIEDYLSICCSFDENAHPFWGKYIYFQHSKLSLECRKKLFYDISLYDDLIGRFV